MTEEQIKVIRSYWENPLFVENASPEDIQSDVLAYLDKLATLQQQQKQLIETLEWYADHKNYHPYRFMSEDGKRARAALQQIQGKDEER